MGVKKWWTFWGIVGGCTEDWRGGTGVWEAIVDIGFTLLVGTKKVVGVR